MLWYNKKYERCGHLFQERFKSECVETDNYFLIALRYIHQNPIEARICKEILDYRWTSYKEYIKEPIIIDTDLCLSLFSPDKDKALDMFIEYMNQKNDYSFPAFEDYIKLTDSEVLNKIYDMGITNISEFQKLEKTIRNNLIKELKMTKGISIRQISRITGTSKGIVERV